jgi:hypothetical protein
MFFINLDMSEILELLGMPKALQKEVQKAGNNLAKTTQAHIIEQAEKKLHSRRQMFIDGLSVFQESDTTWIINLDAKVKWIDEGMEAHNMLDDLLGSKNVKRTKDGDEYVVIPFAHSKGPTQQTPAQRRLTDTIKAELREVGISYGKLAVNKDGSPKLGLVHKMDINQLPIKAFDGPGQGSGPVGDVMQGPTGIPLLKGVQIYQRKVTDKAGKEFVRREVMTFRIASSKHRGQAGRWDYPGVPPTNLMDDGAKWAREQWEKVLAPRLMANLVAKIG